MVGLTSRVFTLFLPVCLGGQKKKPPKGIEALTRKSCRKIGKVYTNDSCRFAAFQMFTKNGMFRKWDVWKKWDVYKKWDVWKNGMFTKNGMFRKWCANKHVVDLIESRFNPVPVGGIMCTWYCQWQMGWFTMNFFQTLEIQSHLLRFGMTGPRKHTDQTPFTSGGIRLDV